MTSGCPAGTGCYIINNTQGDVIASCFETIEDPPAIGDPCTSLLGCAPGAECFQEVSPEGMFTGDRLCREICNAGSDDPDAGSDGGMDGDTSDGDTSDGDTSDGDPPDSDPTDSDVDAGMDADTDAEPDAESDAEPDAAPDAEPDTGPTRTGACTSTTQVCVPVPRSEGRTALTPTPPGICQ